MNLTLGLFEEFLDRVSMASCKLQWNCSVGAMSKQVVDVIFGVLDLVGCPVLFQGEYLYRSLETTQGTRSSRSHYSGSIDMYIIT